MDSNANSFPYQAISSAAGEIRLLTIEPHADSTTDVSCRLSNASLGDPPPYEALSYMWGDPKYRNPILLNGQQFMVNANLDAALHYLRKTNESRTIWADAICIDQGNFAERASQVRQMRDVYRKCRCCLLWLGLADGINALTLEFLEQPLPTDKNEAIRAAHTKLTKISSLSQTNRVMKDLKIMLKEYAEWNRMWIVQEVSLAPHVQVILGKHNFSWEVLDAFSEATFWMWRLEQRGQQFDLGHLPAGMGASMAMFRQRRRSQSGEYLPLYKVWHGMKLSGCECTEEKDNIFALLGLVDSELNIHPEYNVDFRQTYNEVTRRCISYYRNLDILSYVTSPISISRNLPTWIPDFASSDYVQNALVPAPGVFTAGTHSLYPSKMRIHSSVSPTMLSVSGLMLGQIFAHISEPRTSAGNDWTQVQERDALVQILAKLEKCQFPPDYYGRETTFDACWRSLCLDHTYVDADEGPRRLRLSDITRLRTAVHAFIDEGTQNHPSNGLEAEDKRKSRDELFLNLQTSIGLRLSAVGPGLLAMVPDRAKEGDELCILWGSPIPHVVHRMAPDDASNTFFMVGPAYVHGVMDGEAMSPSAIKIGDEIVLNLI